MKKLIFILLLFPILIYSQVYTAGTVYPYSFDINPDKSLSYYYGSSPSTFVMDSLLIDMNNDTQNDIKIKKRQVNSNGGGQGFVIIMSLNPNVYFRSSITSTQAAQPLNIGDSISSGNAIWNNTSKYITIDDKTVSVPTPYNFTLWHSTNDYYAGIRHISGNDTTYGWIRINCQAGSGYSTNVLIKDLSFQTIAAKINEHKLNSLKVFPNPIANTLNILGNQNQFENSQLELVNYLGQTVLKVEFTNTIDVSQLAQGIYTLKIISKENQNYYSKFVKE